MVDGPINLGAGHFLRGAGANERSSSCQNHPTFAQSHPVHLKINFYSAYIHLQPELTFFIVQCSIILD